MNKLLIVFLSAFCLFIVSCEPETGRVQEEKIDEAADEVKEGLDELVNNASKFLEGDGPDKLKDFIDELADKGKEIGKDGSIWKAKIEKLQDDPDVQKLLKKLKSEGKDLEEKMERLSKEIENDPVLKEKLEDIKNLDELHDFVEKYEGKGKDALQELESTLRELDESGIIQKKFKELENDEELKELLKKYEKDGKELLNKLEDIFGEKVQ